MKIRGYITIFAIVAVTAFEVGCSRRVALSDNELALVFRDAFITNAYTTVERIKVDSLKLYEPIFQRYGYTTEDVQYSIGNFSTRKSARLSDVVERAIAMLEEEGKRLDYEVAILDTINAIALRRTSKIVYRDSLLTFTSQADSADMRITLDNAKRGIYNIDFDYLIDSLDKHKRPYKTLSRVDREIWDEELDSIVVKSYSENTSTLRRNQIAKFNHQLSVNNEDDRVVIDVVTTDKSDSTHHVRVKNLRITYEPNTEQALDSLYRQLLPVKIFDDELLFAKEEDSL